MRPFRVQMSSGDRYWTVIDDELRLEPVADRYLRQLRFGEDRAELAAKAYAGGVAWFFRWCLRTGRGMADSGGGHGLVHRAVEVHPASAESRVLLGPGAKLVRELRRRTAGLQ